MSRRNSEPKGGRIKTLVDEGQEVVNQEPPRNLTDEQIVTERKLPRRSFLTAAGTLLAGGALAMVSGSRAAAQQPDSDAKSQKEDEDADKKKVKRAKSKKGKKAKGSTKDTDADQVKSQEQPK
jgi:hypothetical protein